MVAKIRDQGYHKIPRYDPVTLFARGTIWCFPLGQLKIRRHVSIIINQGIKKTTLKCYFEVLIADCVG